MDIEFFDEIFGQSYFPSELNNFAKGMINCLIILFLWSNSSDRLVTMTLNYGGKEIMDKKSVSSKSETNQDVAYKKIAWGGSTKGRGGSDSLTNSHKQASECRRMGVGGILRVFLSQRIGKARVRGMRLF